MTAKYGSVTTNANYNNNIIAANNNRTHEYRLPVYVALEPVTTTRRFLCFGSCGSSGWFTTFLFFYVFFIFAGAVIFSVLETPAEQTLISNVISAREHFGALYPNVKGRLINITI